MAFVIDTHTLVWFLQDNRKLPLKNREMIASADAGEVIIPAIVLAELMFISHRVHMDFIRTLNAIENSHTFEVFSLTPDVIRVSALFNKLEMHDALIVATARMLKAPLMTSDRDIIKSGLIKVI